MIVTERLLLRRPRLGDDLTAFTADEEVQRWIGRPTTSPAKLLERWIERWDRNGVGQYVVELDGEIIGRVGFVVWDSRTWETSAYDLAEDAAETELGWALLSSHWGRGYATEAARAARASIARGRIISLIHPENRRSQRVAEKLDARPTERIETPHGPADVWVHP